MEAPDEVTVEPFEENGQTVLELDVAEEDVGRIIGRHGRTARSLRTILHSASLRTRKRYQLEIRGIAGEFITIARVLRPQGRRGEVLAELHTDFPRAIRRARELSGLAPNGSRRELQLEEHWFHKGGVVLKFAGVDSISDAERLAGCELQVPQEQRSQVGNGFGIRQRDRGQRRVDRWPAGFWDA